MRLTINKNKMQLKRGFNKNISNKVLRGTAQLIGGRLTRTLITIGGIAILARLLTPADFGVFAVAAMILPLANALLEGIIDVPVIREDTLDRDGLANLIWIGIIFMALISTGLWLLAPWLASLLNSPDLEAVLKVLGFSLVIQPFIVASHAVLRREHKFNTSALFMPVSGAVYVISACGLAVTDLGYWSLVVAQITSLVVTATGLTLISNIPVSPPSRINTNNFWRLGGLGLATRTTSWAWANIDTLFASAMLGATGAGIYSRAYNITTQIKEIFAAVEQTTRQAFLAQRDLDNVAASRATLNGLRLIVLAASLIGATIILLREPLIAVLLGAQWEAVTLPLVVLTASLPARVARLYLDGFTYARGSMKHMLVRDVTILALMTTGLWLWASNGVAAIALTVAGAQLITLLFRGGPVDIAIAGSTSQRLQAIAPGYLAAIVLIFLGELASILSNDLTKWMDWIIRAAISLTLSFLLIRILPNSWLPNELNNILQKNKILYPKKSKGDSQID